MTLFVPYDASALADSALARAASIGAAFDLDVVAFTAVPERAAYARDRGWLPEDASFDSGAVAETLEDRVDAVAPDATHQMELVDAYASAGHLSRIIREAARRVDATVAFIGSENAGHVMRPASSVGSVISAADEFDVCIVRSETAVGFATQ